MPILGIGESSQQQQSPPPLRLSGTDVQVTRLTLLFTVSTVNTQRCVEEDGAETPVLPQSQVESRHKWRFFPVPSFINLLLRGRGNPDSGHAQLTGTNDDNRSSGSWFIYLSH
ncbi:hypothetical protein E2C01_034533 [Portunus trituberculatus]|uniref:Uncharacterized protein n=1 Tax=Portunus trituberculatus TaxID=210409 RepID=A0A5B7F6J8_PORTR|nr:hypothetical protein [Portunus trituberculatus]